MSEMSGVKRHDDGSVEKWNPALARWEIFAPAIAPAASKPLAVVEKRAPLSAVPSYRGGSRGSDGWFTIHDTGGDGPWPGSWQQDAHISDDGLLSFGTVYSCMTLIASDIGKVGLRLMDKHRSGIWIEAENSAAFSPVLRKPNHFQTRQQFIECWMLSKLSPRGNTYVLKERDQRGVVVALYVLDPSRCRPLVAPNGEVFYEIDQDDLSHVPHYIDAIPASEIIHDRANCMFHPLVGISPIFACGLAAAQGLKILQNSARFFGNMSRPSGILTAPGAIDPDTAKDIKERWEKNYGVGNVGRVAVLGNDLTYAPIATTAHDAELVAQLKLSALQVCSAYHVPPYKVGAADVQPNISVEALNIEYYSQCLQTLYEAVEALLDDGLGLDNAGYSSEFNIDDLLRMDSAALIKSLNDAVAGGWMAANEARAKRGLLPVKGGESPLAQQQNYSLAALAKRDAQEDPFATAKPPAPPAPVPTPAPDTAPSDAQARHLLYSIEKVAAEAREHDEEEAAEAIAAAVIKRLNTLEASDGESA